MVPTCWALLLAGKAEQLDRPSVPMVTWWRWVGMVMAAEAGSRQKVTMNQWDRDGSAGAR